MKKHRRRRRRNTGRLFLVLLAGVCLLTAVFSAPPLAARRRVRRLENAPIPSWVDMQFIPVGGSRTGQRLSDITGVVIHYVGNPGTTAMGNRNYFAKPDTEVCSHFVVGLEGEVVQCLPLEERSVASNSRNRDTISIEVCHPDESGRFNTATYDSLVRLTAFLCHTARLSPKNVIRHYDVTGKECPRYYVANEEAWLGLLEDIKEAMQDR